MKNQPEEENRVRKKSIIARSFIIESTQKLQFPATGKKEEGENKMTLSMLWETQPNKDQKTRISMTRQKGEHADIMGLLTERSNPSEKSNTSSLKIQGNTEIISLLQMPDQQFKTKYMQDPMFRTKMDLKLQKFVANSKGTRKRSKTQNININSLNNSLNTSFASINGSDQKQGSSTGNILTLNQAKQIDEEAMWQLYEKYLRIFGELGTK